MPKRPEPEEIERKIKKRPTLDVLNATLNAMKSDELEDALVKAGLATYVYEKGVEAPTASM